MLEWSEERPPLGWAPGSHARYIDRCGRHPPHLINDARAITAPYVDGNPPRIPERIATLLARPAGDLSRREHVVEICGLTCSLETERKDAEAALVTEREAHAAATACLEALLADDALLPKPANPHEAETLDRALDEDETRVATDAELACPCGAPWGAHASEAFGIPACPPSR
jgi:hypothetical protein